MNANNTMSYELAFSKVKGKISFQKPMRPLTWLRLGGDAEVFFQPLDVDDLSDFMSVLPKDVNVMPIGVCSNLLVRDGGLSGVTVRLGRGFSEISADGRYVTAGAAALDSRVAEFAAERGIDLSFLRTIPGTIGGAVKMNAGCYGSCVEDIFVSCEVVTRAGDKKVMNKHELKFSYRKSGLMDDTIVTKVTLEGKELDSNNIKKIMSENQKKRLKTQPVREKTGGSTFKNPKIFHQKSGLLMSAWQLIDEANLRGVQLGGAKVSELHSNFLINSGNATAEDFELLGELIQNKVFSASGIELEWEIKRGGSRQNAEKSYKNMDEFIAE